MPVVPRPAPRAAGRPHPCHRGSLTSRGHAVTPKHTPPARPGSRLQLIYLSPAILAAVWGKSRSETPCPASEGMQPVFPLSAVAGYPRPEKSQRSAAPKTVIGGRITRPYTAGRLKSRTERKAPRLDSLLENRSRSCRYFSCKLLHECVTVRSERRKALGPDPCRGGSF